MRDRPPRRVRDLRRLRPTHSAMLILPGNDIWDGEAFVSFAAKAREFLKGGVPVAGFFELMSA